MRITYRNKKSRVYSLLTFGNIGITKDGMICVTHEGAIKYLIRMAGNTVDVSPFPDEIPECKILSDIYPTRVMIDRNKPIEYSDLKENALYVKKLPADLNQMYISHGKELLSLRSGRVVDFERRGPFYEVLEVDFEGLLKGLERF